MKIIEPSANIIEDNLSQLSIYQRIDCAASVCYQRNPKQTEEEAQAFCRKMVSTGHFATLEMAVVHLVCDDSGCLPESKYIQRSRLNWQQLVLSGSIRAFVESPDEYGSWVWNFLAKEFPLFFAESDNPKYERVRFAQPHEIPWQHRHVAVRFVVNRAVSHEIVRHRPCSFLQESQRYVKYSDDVIFIRPEWVDGNHTGNQPTAAADIWESAVRDCEYRYKGLLKSGRTTQQARAVLPNSTKTELIVYASLPQWLHIFSLRDSKAADPEMVRVMAPLHQEFKEKYPEAFA